MSDLWTEATYDAEAATRAHNLEIAKAASSGTWSFLAQAQSEQEYADRVALASDAITAVATAHNVSLDTLLSTFDHRFALLMEAKNNPFGNKSQDSSGDDSKESKDDDSDDKDDKDENGDGHDDHSDSDEDSDDTGDGDDEDSDDDSSNQDDNTQDNGNNAPPWANKMSALAQRIQAGENPLEWGGATPFVRSSARDDADGAEPLTDTSTPQQPDGPKGPDSSQGETDAPNTQPPGDTDVPDPTAEQEGAQPTLPGLDGGIASTTKPRQLPEGDGGTPGTDMGEDGITEEFDPDSNGGDIKQGADDLPGQPDDGTTDKTAMYRKVAAIAREVKRYNPTLSGGQCYKVAQQVYDTYLHKHADDVNPLLYGDRGPVGDGPISGPLKNWSPADMKPPKLPGSTETPKTPSTPSTGEGPKALPAAGEAGAGEAAELLPLLAL